MDEFPVGGGSGGGIGGGGSGPTEEDFSKMPLEDRLGSKVWKARVSGYEELLTKFEKSPSEDAPIFRPYTRNPDSVKSMVTDSNAVAQEKALETVKAFLSFGGKSAGATRETVMPALIEKCFGAMRAGTKKSALDIVSLFAESEDIVGCEGLVGNLIQGTSAKQPKVIATSVTALMQIVRDFGPKQVTFKPILKKLPDFFGHSDKNVRAEAGLLAQELHKWIGAALEPTLAALKEIQAKELREQFAAIDQAGQKHQSPTRYLISQKPVESGSGDAEADGQVEGDEEGGNAEAEAVDTFEFLDPKDPLKSKDWPENFDEMISSAKWLERKEVLDQCLKVLEATPRMIHSPTLDSIIDILSEKVKKDANINVVLSACQCIQKFALGLRTAFAKNKDKALPALLEKLKERKESTVKVLADTLDAIFQTVTFTDILEQTLNATKHKNPQVKTGAIQFLVRCLRETRSMPAKSDIKPIADALVAATADGSADVRDAGAQGLGTLMKLIGERAMNQYIDGLDDIKKGKIQEQYKIATVKVKQAGPAASSSKSIPPSTKAPVKPTARPTPAAVKKPAVVATATRENTVSAPPSAKAPVAAPRGPPARLVAGANKTATKATPPAAKPAAAPIKKTVGGGGAAVSGSSKAAGVNEPVKYRFHPDEAESRATDLVPSHIQEELSTSVWKDRLAAMVKFNEWLKLECENVESELVVRFLSKKPGWKESNFQVMTEVYNAFKMLAADCSSFGRSSVAISIIPLCEKLGDIKLKGAAADTLMQYGERTSIGFVMAQALTPLNNLKAPKAIADSLLWINQALLDFGTANIDVRGLVDHLLTCLKSANAAVRTNATLCIGTLSRFLGSALTNLLGDINPQLRATVEGEIEKASKDTPPTPSRTCEETRPKASAAGVASTDEGPSGPSQEDEDALDALIPRVDLDNLIPSATIAKVGDANWKERKEALEEINAILDANARLKPKMGELGTALKMRFSDNNVQVRTMALDALSKIATGMGRGFEGFVKTFVPSVTQVLADAKVPMRASAAKALTAMAEQSGVAPMISGFVSVLESKAANPALRQDLFSWLGDWFEHHPPDKNTDLNGLALPAIVCLDDKLAAIRKAAQSVLPFIIMRAGYKFVMDQTGSLKAASRNTAIPLIDAARAQASSKAPPPPPPSQSVSARLEPGASGSAKGPNVVRRAQAPSTNANGDAHSATASTSSVPNKAGLQKAPTAVGRTLKASAPVRSVYSASAVDATPARLPKIGVRKTAYTPAATGSSSSSNVASVEKSAPFVNADEKYKMIREKREGGRQALYWIGPDANPKPELVESLRGQCEHHVSSNLVEKMFSKDHNAERDYLSALTLFMDHLSHTETSMDDFAITQEEAIARIKANSDLLFKYVAIRLTDNNTSIALKCLDLLHQLLAILRDQEYHMSDYEANAILPCILGKFGDPKVAFRDRIRSDILRKITYIYPPSKVLSHYIEEGLPSKNSRVRTECLTELGHLFHKYGTQICSLPKTMPLIACQISDRDNGVRTGALMAISEVYKVVGDSIWQFVGELPLRDRGLLEEKLRRVALPASTGSNEAEESTLASVPAVRSVATSSATPAAGGIQAPKVRSGSSQLPPPGQSRMAMPSRLVRPTSIAGQAGGVAKLSSGLGGVSDRQIPSRMQAPTTIGSGIQRPGQRSVGMNGGGSTVAGQVKHERSNSAHADSLIQTTTLSKKSEANDGHEEEYWDVEQTINEILSSDSDRSVRALKKLASDIQNCSPALTQNADRLAVAYGKLMHRAYGQTNHTNDVSKAEAERLKKHLMYTGTNVFDNTRLWEDPIDGTQRTLGSYVTKSALVILLTELLSQLIGTKGATDAETQTQGRYLNIMVLRSFSSCNMNVLFGACLLMLTEATEDLEDLQSRGDAVLVDKRVKFADLICKCIWKMTRKLTQSLQDEAVDAAILLQDLEAFLQAIPPEVWKERAANGMPMGDIPLRTVKVIITHIGNAFGEQALDLLEGIPDAENSRVYTYLLRVCDRVDQNGTNGSEEIGSGRGGIAPEDAVFDDEAQARLSPTISTISSNSAHNSAPSTAALRSRAQSASATLVRSESQSTVGGTDEDTAVELRRIFDRIGNKTESRAAIKDLYLFSRKHPEKEALIMRSLEQTGPIFQKFIKRAMANHAMEDGEPSPFIDDTMTPRQSMLISSPNISTASPLSRNSLPISHYSTRNRESIGLNGQQQRNSFMSPSPSRNSNLNLAGLVDQSSPSTPARSGFKTPNSPALTSSPSMNRMSVNDDRLAQLRAKFARSSSMQNTAAENP